MPCMIRFFKGRDIVSSSVTALKELEIKNKDSFISNNEASINDFSFNYLNPNYQKE